ncbi:hypothetical protein [Tenacibaculum aiptasiae]|uniref:hypothetical protein n=1 Tax=Tenacibaculum aiptasiae TaxID=426481 RepID=UPI003B5A5E73
MIIQTGNDNQASTGNNSSNTRGGKHKTILPNKKEIGWFTGGIVLPLIVGLILELFKQGEVSKIFTSIIKIFS